MNDLRRWLRAPWFGPLLALGLLYALFAALAPDTFARSANLLTMLRQTAVTGVASVGMTLIIVLGGIDLSVGSAVALVTVVVAECLRSGMNPLPAAICGIFAGGALGLFNGALVTGLKISPFIVTLGTMSVLRGAAKGIADEQKIDADPHGIDHLMQTHGHLLGVPPGVWLMLASSVFGVVLLEYAKIGRQIVAVGSNAETARLCGISIPKTTLFVYTLAGLFVGLAGLLEFSTLTVGDPTDSVGLELDVIAAVVIGGGSLAGGQGSAAGALAGALLLTVIKAGCTHLGLPNWVQEIFTGFIIVIAMSIDKLRQRAR
ncbi:MAG TPA: ABC transporter permease [Polyangiaceae bacterium]|jgi:ribose transport system permease protein|nr:ABC transporter permease [Polyangiaceae bacterium]